jgi:hypothetical protein
MGRTRDTRKPCAAETIRMHNSHEVTLLDVIRAVSAVAVNDEDTIATVIHLISSGQVRLSAEAITAMTDVWATADAAA